MDAQRALLDELMGTARNLTEEEKKGYRELRWDDKEVCAFYMVRFCPHDLFVNTRSDLGLCPRVHDPKLKESFEKSSRHDAYVPKFEAELAKFCEKLVEALNAEKTVLTQQPQNDKVLMLAQEKKMALCEVCGSFLVANDAAERTQSHVTGKQHIGYGMVRDFISEFKEAKEKAREEEKLAREKEAEEQRKQKEKEYESRRSRSDSGDRDKYRDRDKDSDRYRDRDLDRERSQEWSGRGSRDGEREWRYKNGRDGGRGRHHNRSRSRSPGRHSHRRSSRSPVRRY